MIRMYSYFLLDSDELFNTQVAQWKQKGITSLGMDFEGEFNLHIYGEHLCLIQLYDETSFFIADPFNLSPAVMKSFMEDSSLEKIMFDCSSDASLMRKQYQIQLENVYDIRIPAMALDYMGNLSGLMEMYHLPHDEGDKKKNQMTNWLTRPLQERQVQYALGDVANLFNLKKILQQEIADKHLISVVKDRMKGCAKQKNPEKAGWEKFPSYRYLTKEQKIYLKHFFIARDNIARKYNVPAVQVLEKQNLLVLAKDIPTDENSLRRLLPRISNEMLEALLQAKVTASQELVAVKPRSF